MARVRTSRDREDDYPTGPIDLTDLSNPYVRGILEDEEQPRLADGTFTFKDKPLGYRHLLPVAELTPPFTLDELSRPDFGEFGPEYAGPHVTVYDWPAVPGVHPVFHGMPDENVKTDVVSICCPDCVTGPGASVAVQVRRPEAESRPRMVLSGGHPCEARKRGGSVCGKNTRLRKLGDPSVAVCGGHGGVK